MKVPQFYVRSNVHMTNLDNAIQRLLVNESLLDVTLACDGHKFQCHRLVLAAASPLFEQLLKEHPKEHPIVIIPLGIKWHILKSLIDFMYRGQTCVDQVELKTLVESAELLQVIGLYDPETQFREVYSDENDDGNCDKEDNNDKEIEEERSQSCPNSDQEENQCHYQENEQHNALEEREEPQTSQVIMKSGNENENGDHIVKKKRCQRRDQNKEVIVDYIEINDSQGELSADEDAITKDDEIRSFEKTKEGESENEEESDETNQLENNNLQHVSPMPVTTDETTQTSSTNDIIPTIRVKPTIKLINLFKLNRPGDSNQSSSKGPWTYIHIPAKSNLQYSNEKVAPVDSFHTAMPQLMPLKTPNSCPVVIANPVIQETTKSELATKGSVPSFLKFNSSSMAISIKNFDQSRTKEKHDMLDMPPESESEERLNQQQDLHQSIGLQKIKEEPQVKTEAMDFDVAQDNYIPEESEAENIICQPNVSYIYDGHDKDIEHIDDDEDGVCIDYDRLVAETYGNSQENPHYMEKNNTIKKLNKKSKKSKSQLLSYMVTEAKTEPSNIKPKLTKHRHHNFVQHQRHKDPPTLVPLSVMNAGLGPKHLNSHKNNDKKQNKGFSNSAFGDGGCPAINSSESHSQNAVILRNPRCNQPRHYSNESLYAALMAVKYGDSIYRASRLHQVPRKTLRNWMKRWDIKSQYPMPKQLKDAAKKKKLNQTQST